LQGKELSLLVMKNKFSNISMNQNIYILFTTGIIVIILDNDCKRKKKIIKIIIRCH